MIDDDNFRIIIIDDNPNIHEDFMQILTFHKEDEKLKSMKDMIFDVDNNSQKEIAADNLGVPTFEIDFATQGIEGVDKVRLSLKENNPFALAFVDVRMPPGLDGIKTIKRIWEFDRYIQIVICTAYTDYSWEDTIKELGMEGNLLILKKPFDTSAVRQLACSLTKKWDIARKERAHSDALQKTLAEQNKLLQEALVQINVASNTVDEKLKQMHIQKELEANANRAATQKNLLLVDDDADSLKALNRLFETETYNIFVATSANEGLELLAKYPIQVMICDQRLSKISGIEFLEVVKDKYPHTIRIAASTSSNFEEVKDAINDGSIYKFISKPVDENLVRQYVRDGFRLYAELNRKHEAEIKLNKLIYVDILTELPNQFALTEYFSKYINDFNPEKTMGVICVGIDNINMVRDNIGDKNTNKVLLEFSTRLKLKAQGQFTATLSGHEFILILEANSISELDNIINEIYTCCTLPIDSISKVYPKISIGKCIYPQDGKHYDILLQNARRALSICRDNGGGLIQAFNAASAKATENILDLEADLHDALDKDQFVLFFQPILSLKTNDIVGVEALIRWNHPLRGLILTDQIVSICESSGLIIPIGEWVIRTACHNIQQLNNEMDKKMHIAVNLSALQFKDSSLYDIIANSLALSKLHPSLLVLEITESLLMGNVTDNFDTLNNLLNLGLKLSIDDFGTGYSSLSYLRTMPFNILKIDKSFIKDIGHSSNSDALLISIISLAKSLGLEIVAEGIETKEQLEFLKTHECDLVQGYFLSKPKPLNELKDFVKGYVSQNK